MNVTHTQAQTACKIIAKIIPILNSIEKKFSNASTFSLIGLLGNKSRAIDYMEHSSIQEAEQKAKNVKQLLLQLKQVLGTNTGSMEVVTLPVSVTAGDFLFNENVYDYLSFSNSNTNMKKVKNLKDKLQKLNTALLGIK